MVGVGRWVTHPPLLWLRICIVFVMQVELVGDVAGIVVVGDLSDVCVVVVGDAAVHG